MEVESTCKVVWIRYHPPYYQIEVHKHSANRRSVITNPKSFSDIRNAIEMWYSKHWPEKSETIFGYVFRVSESVFGFVMTPRHTSKTPQKKFGNFFFTLPFLIFIQFLFARWMKSITYHVSLFSEMTPPRSQSDDSGLSNSREQADGWQNKSDKIAINVDAIEHSSLHSYHTFINFSTLINKMNTKILANFVTFCLRPTCLFMGITKPRIIRLWCEWKNRPSGWLNILCRS